MRGTLVILGFSLSLPWMTWVSLFAFQGDKMDKNKVNLVSASTDFIEDDDKLVLHHSQNISKSFLDDLTDSRNHTSGVPSGEFLRVASIPTIVVEKWMREGFNIWEASGKEIVKRLKDEDLGGFMATDKRI